MIHSDHRGRGETIRKFEDRRPPPTVSTKSDFKLDDNILSDI
jgi:hypothetical protein